MNVNHQGTTLFVTIFTYDQTGDPMWLVGSNVDEQIDGSFSGPIYLVSGPPFDTAPWSAAVTRTQLGNIKIQFATTDAATVTYNLGVTYVSKSLQKQVFGIVPTCTPSTSSRGSETNYQDLWWNPSESGWGINLTHQGNLMFATLFTYDRRGYGIWLVASNLAKQADGTYAGLLYTTRGPPFDALAWSTITVTQVGTMALRFMSGDAATLSYSYSGATVTKTIQRQVFGQTVPLCK